MTAVDVKLHERSYTIEIGTDVLGQLGAHVADWCAPSHAVVITDENVEKPHALAAATSLSQAGATVDLLVVEPGEQTKNVASAAGLWDKMLALGADRKSVVVAVGGGVVGDLAGFVAATFARGLAYVQVPTTLLAQVDSSVGGKVGVNLAGGKNMVGAFWQPAGVLIDTAVLDTLPEREYTAGLAEVVKYGVILDADFFAYLEAHAKELSGRDADVLQHVVARCCRLKADVVEADERELTGGRAVLNYGHTFCHALETVTGYGRYLHGEAVAIGMLCASRLAERLGRVDAELTERQQKLLTALKLPVDFPALDHEALLAAMARDKKVEHGRLRFVLPSRMGHVELVGDIDQQDVRAVLGD
ncbi:MAG: 3-dehydroquinate synthase [Planctomycetota bacterium]|nr:MAG: 3-dehydroquinate synthase [Planctomycetota bacterium]